MEGSELHTCGKSTGVFWSWLGLGLFGLYWATPHFNHAVLLAGDANSGYHNFRIWFLSACKFKGQSSFDIRQRETSG